MLFWLVCQKQIGTDCRYITHLRLIILITSELTLMLCSR